MNKDILLSIKTKYAHQIFNGTKLYEYRRKTIGEKNINKKIYIYSSEEDKAIIGYILIEKILKGDLNNILKETNCKNNIDIINYFKNCDICYALKISKTFKFEKPLSLQDIKKIDSNFCPPQFYRYIKENEYIFKELKQRKIINNLKEVKFENR